MSRTKRSATHLLAVCFGLSIGWHVLSALLIGGVPEPQVSYADACPPTLTLARPLEWLNLGLDAKGKGIVRPVMGYHDPDFFGYPRAWHADISRGSHEPYALEAQKSEGPSGLGVLAEPVFTFPELVPDAQWDPVTIDTPDGPAASAARQNGRPMTLIVEGPLLARQCLVQVLPDFESQRMGQKRSLILGQKAASRGPDGLVLRIWVARDGTVRYVVLEGSSGDENMDRIAAQALRQWRFQAIEEGAPFMWGRVSLRPKEIP